MPVVSVIVKYEAMPIIKAIGVENEELPHIYYRDGKKVNNYMILIKERLQLVGQKENTYIFRIEKQINLLMIKKDLVQFIEYNNLERLNWHQKSMVGTDAS